MTWFFRWMNYDDLARCLDEMNVDVLQLWGYSPLWFVEDPAADGMEVGAWDVQSWIFWGTSLTGNPHFSCSKEPWHILSKTSTLLERWDSLSTSSGTTMWPSAMFGTGWRKWTKKPSRGVHWVHQFWGGATWTFQGEVKHQPRSKKSEVHLCIFEPGLYK